MTSTYKPWLLAMLIFSPTCIALANNEVAVIVNPAYEGDLDKNRIEQIFLGQINTMRPYDQPDSSPVAERFYNAATGRSMQQINAQRAKLLFSGRGRAPEELINSRAVKSAVARDPQGIGYVEKSAVDDSVKVIMVLQ